MATNTKEYLNQIGILRARIEQREEQLKELRILAMSNKGIAYDAVKVQTSPTNGMPELDRYLDQAIRVKKMIDEYIRLKDVIITQIHGMEDKRFMIVLYLRFVEGMRIDGIANKMHYSRARVNQIQRKAIRAFGAKYAEQIKDYTKLHIEV